MPRENNRPVRKLRRIDNGKVPPAEAETIAGLLHSFMRHLGKGHNDAVVRELPLAQLRLCHALGDGPRPMSSVSRDLGTSLSAITQIADRLERARLVKRVPRGDDRRVRCLQLTGRGEKMMRLHEDARVERMAKMLEHLTTKERQAVADALRTMVRASAAASGEDGDGVENGFHPIMSRVLL
jgi:DNA-binding MarR family transcriptional regulator